MNFKNNNQENLPSVLFLTQGDRNLASSRFRVFQFIENIEDGHFKSQVLSLPESGVFARIRFLLKALYAALSVDVVFIQKIMFPIIYLRWMRRFTGRLVYDWDDALYTTPPRINIKFRKQSGRLKRLNEILSMADTVICGNDVLAEYCKSLCNDCRVIPTSIQISKHPQSYKRLTEVVTIGWIGRAENLEYLEKLKKVFDAIYQKYGTCVQLMVVCDKPLILDSNLTIINKKWNLKDEENDIKGFDIGIMPLEDTQWARGKCAFKLLQYMAFGVACIGSPVGANKQVVNDADNGLLATTYEEWLNALFRLIDDPLYRKQLVASAKLTVEKEYSVAANKQAFVGAVLGDI